MQKVALKRTRTKRAKIARGFGKGALLNRRRYALGAGLRQGYWGQAAPNATTGRRVIFYFPITQPCRLAARSKENLLSARTLQAIVEFITWRVAAVMRVQKRQTVGSALRMRPKQR